MDTEKLLDEADLLILSSNYDKAIEMYSYILDRTSDCDEAYLMRGALLGEKGQIENAISDVEESIRLYDENDSAYVTLALLYEKNNNFIRAVELCRKSIALNRNNSDAKKLIVQLLIRLGDEMLDEKLLEKADRYFRSALEYEVNNSNLYYKAALVASRKGSYEESIELATKSHKLDPNFIDARAHIASVYEMMGDVETGSLLVEELNRQYPKNPTVNLVFAQIALRNKQQDKGIEVLERLILRDSVPRSSLANAYMLLGALYDSIEEYGLAIKYFKQANKSSHKDYDTASYEKYISGLISYFSKDKYSSIPQSENLSDDLIFIVGMPRSGTSLIEHIIASHSGVYGAGELTHVFNVIDAMQTDEFSDVYPDCLDMTDTDIMNMIAGKLYTKIRSEHTGTKKIVDKLPHNYHHIGFLHKLFPKAKFINCERDPRDSCLSCFFQNFSGYHPYSTDLRALGLHYKEYERLMNHWVEGLGIPVLSVSYEDVVSNTRQEIVKVLNFLDLEWEENCMEFYKQKRIVTTASYNQVNKKIHTGSVGRWKNYKEYISDLLEVIND